jgi:hypothetical protein
MTPVFSMPGWVLESLKSVEITGMSHALLACGSMGNLGTYIMVLSIAWVVGGVLAFASFCLICVLRRHARVGSHCKFLGAYVLAGVAPFAVPALWSLPGFMILHVHAVPIPPLIHFVILVRALRKATAAPLEPAGATEQTTPI